MPVCLFSFPSQSNYFVILALLVEVITATMAFYPIILRAGGGTVAALNKVINFVLKQ